MKILVVDDEKAFCENIKDFLVRVGYAVFIATDGKQGLNVLEDEQPDIMMLDIRMPGMSGHEVLEAIRKSGSSVKVIVVSAVDIPDMEETFIRAGAKAVLYKPIDLKLLLETIKALS